MHLVHFTSCFGPTVKVLLLLMFERAAKGWTSSIVPGILISTSGYAIGTFIGLATGNYVR